MLKVFLRTISNDAPTLINAAVKAPEYSEYKHPDRCVRHDIAKLLELGLITISNLMISAVASGERTGATPRLHMESTP